MLKRTVIIALVTLAVTPAFAAESMWDTLFEHIQSANQQETKATREAQAAPGTDGRSASAPIREGASAGRKHEPEARDAGNSGWALELLYP